MSESMTISGFWDDRSIAYDVPPRRTKFQFHRKRGCRPFIAQVTLRPDSFGIGEVSFGIEFSDADKRRLAKYLSPKHRARMRRLHTAYRRRHR